MRESNGSISTWLWVEPNLKQHTFLTLSYRICCWNDENCICFAHAGHLTTSADLGSLDTISYKESSYCCFSWSKLLIIRSKSENNRKNLKSVPTVKFEFWTSDPTCFSWEHGETIVPRRFRTKISLTMVSHTVSQVLVQTVSHGSKKWKVMARHRRRSAAKVAPLNSSQKALFRGCG